MVKKKQVEVESTEDQPEPVEITAPEVSPEVPVVEEVDPNVIIEQPNMKVSVTLVCEVQPISMSNVAGNPRQILLNHAKQEWKERISNIDSDQVTFENC